jgi:hypothetical protein
MPTLYQVRKYGRIFAITSVVDPHPKIDGEKFPS